MASTWVENSNDFTTEEDYSGVFVGTMVASCCILIHSFYLHRFQVNPIRVATDIAAICVLMAGVCLYHCLHKGSCSEGTTKVTVNLLGNGLLPMIMQVCENYMTISRYSAVVGGLSTRVLFLIYGLVFVLMYLTWIPFVTITPFFLSGEWITANVWIVMVVYVISYILFNVIFCVLLLREIHRLRRVLQVSASPTDALLQRVAVGAFCHAFTTGTGIVFVQWTNDLGFYVTIAAMVCALHIFLNVKAVSTYLLLVLQELPCGLRKQSVYPEEAHTPADGTAPVELETVNL